MQKEIFKTLFKYAKPHKTKIILALLLTLSTVFISSFIAPMMTAKIIDALQLNQTSWNQLLPYVIGFSLSVLWGIIGWRLTIYLTWKFEIASQKNIYEDVFEKIINETVQFHADKFSGSLVSQTSKLTSAFERFFDAIIFSIMPLLISIIAATILLLTIFWQYAIILLVLALIYMFSVYKGSSKMIPKTKAEAKASTEMSGYLSDNVANVLIIKSFATEKKELKKAMKVSKNWVDKSQEVMFGFLKLSMTYATIMGVMRVAAIISVVIAAQFGLMKISTLFLVMSYTMTVIDNLWQMNNIMRQYNSIMGDASQMVEILNSPIAIIDKSNKKLKASKGKIQFKNVTFGHADNNGEKLFKNFNLEIEPGQKVGLIGHSGSGKTSLTKLLLRFYDIEEGTIEIDDQDISSVTQKSLHGAIAYVPQEPSLFHRSIKENISYGNDKMSDKDIVKIAKLARADEFIKKLSDKYDTLVGERGVKLSGGQRQRVAIARAMAKKASILVLDEATSALDSESEQLIQEALDEIMKNKTSLVVAHRLSTVAKLDRIIVMEDGEIVEDGNHNELIAKNGVYAKLWARQSNGFIED